MHDRAQTSTRQGGLTSSRACLALGIGLLALTFGWPLLARPQGHDLCLDAAREAARDEGVPLDLMLAIAMVESGIDRGDGAAPWPWTLHFQGKGHWLPDQAQARALAETARAAGVSNIDLGCFQINFRWHGQNFASLDAMLDPLSNARYAARLLRAHHARLGSWQAAAGAYHSATPDLAQAYLSRVTARLGRLPDADPSPVPTPVTAHIRAPALPLPATPGAIQVALHAPAQALIGRSAP